jgi:hypothetical protein
MLINAKLKIGKRGQETELMKNSIQKAKVSIEL